RQRVEGRGPRGGVLCEGAEVIGTGGVEGHEDEVPLWRCHPTAPDEERGSKTERGKSEQLGAGA
ncbi:MAG: hypothetical protein O2799_08380, partial [Planctomycetota bacterium]|nr:hypothetical protein [Planctomycetota bacterium]